MQCADVIIYEYMTFTQRTHAPCACLYAYVFKAGVTECEVDMYKFAFRNYDT